MKTVLVLVLGWTLFNSALTMKNLGGMIVAVIGMIIYSWAVEKGKQEAAEALQGANSGRAQGHGRRENAAAARSSCPEEKPPPKF